MSERPKIVTKRAQVRAILEKRIRTSLHAGDAIASERELVSELGVSRVTVRQAISDLVDEGLLERTQGKGTYVTGPKINSRLHLMSFSREMRARGLEPRTDVLSALEQQATANVARGLMVEVGDPVVRLERIRLADGTPIAHEVGYYPCAMFPGLLEHKLNFVYDLLADSYGIEATHGEQVVHADTADADRARILGIPRRAPLLVQERVTFCDQTPFELSCSWFRADRYRIHSTIRPREHGLVTA